MKREIKFRAWDESQKYMAYQGTPDLETIQSFMHHFGDKELMQFTGLTDKNGKEIYEGDLIYYEYDDRAEETGKGICVGMVVFENGCFVVKQPNFDYEKANEKPFTLHKWLTDDECFIKHIERKK